MNASIGEILLAPSEDLQEGAVAIGFDVMYQGEICRGFCVRFEGQPHAYLNRCTHVPVELDFPPGQIFDDSGQWLVCSSHGAVYEPNTGNCAGGPCQGALVRIDTMERDGQVFWLTTDELQPVEF